MGKTKLKKERRLWVYLPHEEKDVWYIVCSIESPLLQSENVFLTVMDEKEDFHMIVSIDCVKGFTYATDKPTHKPV